MEFENGKETSYSLEISTYHSKIRLDLMKNGSKVRSHWARLKAETEFGLVQAISYAAYGMLLDAEREAHEKQNQGG